MKLTISPTESVDFTCPVIVAGHIAAEFDAAVEIVITHRHKPQTYYSPAEGPEWEVRGYWIDCGPSEEAGWKIAPDDLAKRMEEYLATDKGRDILCDHIREAA